MGGKWHTALAVLGGLVCSAGGMVFCYFIFKLTLG